MDHHAVSDIDAHMRDTANLCTHRALKEHQIARSDFIRPYLPASPMQSGCAEASGIVHAGIRKHPADKARTVK